MMPLYRPTVSVIPYSRASAMRACPIRDFINVAAGNKQLFEVRKTQIVPGVNA